MELTFIFYLFSAFITIPGIFFIFALYRKYLAGSISAIGILVFFILFGIQTFNPDGSYINASSSTMSWPPVINFCPDFLTLLKVGSDFVCVDTVGVSTDGTGIQKYIANNAVVGTPSVSDNQSFHLSLNITNVDDRRTAIVDECKAKKVTWQGIFDGVSQSSNTVPRPPGT
jgi:hypothetical protein